MESNNVDYYIKEEIDKRLTKLYNSPITDSSLPTFIYSTADLIIENEKLGEIYQAHDVFILPSYYEPWGLVVEEALYWGLPVIVSDCVGSSVDMVAELDTGIIFKSKDRESLHAAIDEMEYRYDEYASNILNIDWNCRDKRQVEAYTSLIE